MAPGPLKVSQFEEIPNVAAGMKIIKNKFKKEEMKLLLLLLLFIIIYFIFIYLFIYSCQQEDAEMVKVQE